MPVTNPQRVTVIRDTGCRMDTSNSQACNDPKAWPLTSLAANAIATNPQLLIHNGDFHYREAICGYATPSGTAIPACIASPWGYNWDVWREDVFKPMQSLLSAAPWNMTRGNHESCDRAGEGWFRYLDPRPIPPSCQIYTDPYSVSIGSVQFEESSRRRSRFRNEADQGSGGKPITCSVAKPISDSDLKAISNRPRAEW